ncbi:MAG TPA: DUF2079 domain-containing protein, partial [Candidatus Baltobacteraceae bacterium]
PSGLLRNAVEGSHFSDHFSPVYDLVMPLVRATSSYVPLLLLQALAGALVAPGLYLIAARLLPERMALGVCALALVYPALAGVTFGDPYENVFAPAVTVWLFAAVFLRRWWSAGMLVLLALAIKEDQALFLLWCGLLVALYALRKHDKALQVFALGTAAVSAGVFALFLCVVRPAFAAGGAWPALSMPINVALHDTSDGLSLAGRLGYVAEMLVPLALLPLWAPRLLLLGLPAIAEVLLSRNSLVWTMGTHYAGAWIGYLLIAAVFGTAALCRLSPAWAQRLVIAAAILCIADLAFASPTHWRRTVHLQTGHDRSLDRIVASLPPNVSLGAHDELYAHLWRRPLAERGLSRSPSYALIDETMATSALAREMLQDIVRATYGHYHLVWQRDDVRLYRREDPAAPVAARTGARSTAP